MTPPNHTIYTVNDANRPPHWRFDRVRYVLGKDSEQQVFLDGEDDAGTRHFYAFCQELNQAKTPEEKFFLNKKYPGIHAALRLRKYSDFDTLGLLEGYFLTETADLCWLSEKFSLDPATVVWYEQLFFDVWSRQNANAWIETAVVRPSLYSGHLLTSKNPSISAVEMSAAERLMFDRACAYRRMGYYGGIVTLELFSTGFLSSDAKPKHRDLAETFIQKALEMSVSNEGALMGQSRRRLNKTEGEFIKLGLDLANRALQTGNADVIQNVQRALRSVTPLVGEDVKEQLTKMAAADMDKAALLVGAAEIRHTELAKLHLGLELSPETRSLVRDYYEKRDQVINI